MPSVINFERRSTSRVERLTFLNMAVSSENALSHIRAFYTCMSSESMLGSAVCGSESLFSDPDLVLQARSSFDHLNAPQESLGGCMSSSITLFLLHRVIIAFFLLFATIGSCIGKDFKIGMSAAFSGPAGGLGIELYRGSSAYLSHINEQGGIFGRNN